MKHSRMCTSPEYFTPDMYLDERLQECTSLFRDVHKSRVIYSGHVLWMRLSRSVPACLKMCTSSEHFNPHMMYLDKTLQECSSVTNCDAWTVFSFSLLLFIACTTIVGHVTDDLYFHT
jgi:hypothetical protein